jgi:hypothetical protein
VFSLIITIISIALVAALAVAGVFFGGSAFTSGTAKANAATVVNQAQQITGANALYANDNAGAFATTSSALQSGGYLSSIPTPAVVVSTGSYDVSAANFVTLDLAATATEVCRQVNKSIGLAATIPTTQPATQYGCWDTGAGALRFFYKG